MAPSLISDESKPVLTVEAPGDWQTQKGLSITLKAGSPGREIAWLRVSLELDGRLEHLQTRRFDYVDSSETVQERLCLRLPGTAPCENTDTDWLLPAAFGRDRGAMTIMAEAADRATAQRAAETVRKQVLIEDRLPPSAGLNDELKTNGADVFYIQGQASDEGSGLSRLGYRFRITGNGRISTTVEGESEAFLPGNGSDLFVIPVVSPPVLRSGEIEVESLWIQDAANPANRTDVLDAPNYCLGDCRDTVPPRVEIISAVWLQPAGNVPLSSGDGLHANAEIEVTVQAVDSGSGIDSIRVETPRERAEYRVEEAQNSPGLVETTLRLRVPDGIDGDRFELSVMAWDDYGDLPDRNRGEAEAFALEIVDDQSPTVEVVGFVNAEGRSIDGPPQLGDEVFVQVQGNDPLGKIVSFTFGLLPEGEDVPTQFIETILNEAEHSGTWTSSEAFVLEADRRAMDNWRIRVEALDNARVPNRSQAIEYPFLPRDVREPILDQVERPRTVHPGRSYPVSVTATDINRVVAELGLQIQPQQTGLDDNPITQVVSPPRNPATGQIPLVIPPEAQEGQFLINGTAADDRGNRVFGGVQAIDIVDDIPPVIDPPSYLESPIQPGIEVTLRVNAFDLNSEGISEVSIQWPEGLIDGENVPLIVALGATRVERPEQFPIDFRGQVRADLAHGRELLTTVTAIDKANVPNTQRIDVLRTVDDRGGPSLASEPLVAIAGASVSLSLTGIDNSGVRQLGYSVAIPHLNGNISPTIRQDSEAFGGENTEESSTFQIIVPETARQSVGDDGLTINLSAEDAVGNLSEGTTPLVIRDETEPHQLDIQAAATATTGGELSVTISAEDQSSGLDSLVLRLLPVGLVVDVDCEGHHRCEATRTLTLPEDLSHGDQLTLELTATDLAFGGGLSAEHTRPVTVIDGSAPELLIQAPAAEHIFVSAQNGTISAQAHDPNSDITSWAWQIQCGRPGAGSVHGQGGGIIANPAPTVLPSQTFTMPHSGHCIANGTLTVTATNEAGLVATTTRIVGIQDSTAPAVNWRNGQSPATANTGDLNVRFDGQMQDPGSGAGRLDLTLPPCVSAVPGHHDYDGEVTQQTSQFLLSFGHDCQPGQHILTLTAQDQAGNDSTVTHRVTVADDDAPSIEFLLPPASASVGTTVNLSLRLHDPSSGLNTLTLTEVPCGQIVGRTWNDQPTNATDHVLEWEIPADCRNLGPQRLTASISDASADSPDGEASILIEITDPTEPSVSFTTTPSEIKIFNTETVAVEASDAAAGLANLTLSFASGSGTFTPSSQSFPGNPVSGTLQSEVLGDSETLRDGDSVRLRIRATDASGNVGEATTNLLTVVDDLAPASADISATAIADAPRSLVNGRFPVAAGESVTLRIEASDSNSGIVSLGFQATWTGGNQSENEAGLAGGDIESHDFTFVVPAIAHGELITVTPRADDASDETGTTSGTPLVLEIDSVGPNSTPVVINPTLSTAFGINRDFRCATTETTTLSGTAGAGVDSVKLEISPLPTAFPADGRELDVIAGAWSDEVSGWSTNYQVYTVTLTPLDAVGNEGDAPLTVTLRSDLIAPSNRNISTLNLDTTGRGVYRPQISGLRSSSTGGETLIRGRIHDCSIADAGLVIDETPNNASFQLSQANTLNLTDNALNCAWEVEETFCQQITSSTGSVNLSKPNQVPNADTLQSQGDSSDPATLDTLRPTFSARYTDPYQPGSNEISFAREVQARVVGSSCPGGLASSVCWTSAVTSVDLDSGQRSLDLQMPRWRPSLANGPTDIRSIRVQSDLLLIEHNTTTVRALDLAGNVWSLPASLDSDGNAMTVNFEAVDGLVVDANDDLIWLDDDGELRVGTTDGNPLNQITWADPQSVANFNSNRCETIELTTSPSGADRLVVWCQGKRPILQDVLTVFEMDRSIDPPTLTEIAYPLLYVPRRLGPDFQVIRLPGTGHFRLLPGDGFEQILSAEITTGPTQWGASPSETGNNLSLGAGCSIAAEGADGRYIVLQGDGSESGWRIESATDTETAMNLPNGLAPPQSDGFFLVAGDGDEELLYLSAGLNLRPVSHDGSGNWVVPPVVGSEAPLARDGDYQLQVRFVDEGGEGGDFADATQAFTLSIP